MDQISKEAFFCGIGDMVDSIEKINTSFIGAVAVMHNIYPYDSQTVRWYSEEEHGQDILLLSESPLFIENFTRGNLERVQEITRDHLKFFSEKTYSLNILMYFCSDLISCIQKILKKMDCSPLNINMEEFLGFNNSYEFCIQVEMIVKKSCEQIERRLRAQQNSLQNDLIHYINENFKNPNLSLIYICDALSISKNTVAHIIKKETGLSYIQYITNIRFTYIKKQLKETEENINQIVTEAGYQNIASFIRRFKEIEGMTPGQYREMVKSLEND